MNGRELAEWRHRHGLSQTQAASWLGISPATVKGYERHADTEIPRPVALATVAVAQIRARDAERLAQQELERAQ